MTAQKKVFSLQLIAFSLLITLIVLFLPGSVLAQSNQPSPPSTPTPVTSENYKAPQNANYTMVNLEHALLCELAGISPAGKCLGLQKDQDQNKVVAYLYDQVPTGGVIGGLTAVMVAMYANPPTSTIQYLADLGKGFGIIKPVYAQVGGSGAGIIEPIKNLWQAVRNLTYLIFIVIFLVVGFMIMFRQRLGPQAVVTIQTALPGLVVGLILVTFSYFIAALLIDLSFVGIQLVAELFVRAGPNSFGNTPEAIKNIASRSNLFELIWSPSVLRLPQNVGEVTAGMFSTIFSGSGFSIGAIITAVIGTVIATMVAGPVGFLAALGVGGAGAVAGAVVGPFLGSLLIGMLVPLILVVALMIQFFRLLFGLISSYIQLLVATTAGPLIILFASTPGRGGALGMWWKTLLANSLIFPAVFAAFLFAGLILSTNPGSWRTAPPLFGGLSTELLRIIIAYGIMLGTPAIPDMIRTALGVKGPQGFTQAALGGFMGGVAVGRAGYGAATARFSEEAQARARAEAQFRAGAAAAAPANETKWWYGLFRGGRH